MPYRLKRKESVATGVKRVAREQGEKSLFAATRSDLSVEKRVHDARTSCKKLRGLLRLVRSRLGDTYKSENAFVRDAARGLSGSRDTAVVLKAFDELAGRAEIDRKVRKATRLALAERLTSDGQDDEERLTAFAGAMRDLLDRIDDWHIRGSGFGSLNDGLVEQYRRGRRAMRVALNDGDSDDWHEWRKPAKSHWYHVRLLRDVWRPAMEARTSELSALAELLGEDHDLALLRTSLVDLDEDGALAVLSPLDERRATLQSAAARIGRRLYAEKPRHFERRMHSYWRIWRPV